MRTGATIGPSTSFQLNSFNFPKLNPLNETQQLPRELNLGYVDVAAVQAKFPLKWPSEATISHSHK